MQSTTLYIPPSKNHEHPWAMNLGWLTINHETIILTINDYIFDHPLTIQEPQEFSPWLAHEVSRRWHLTGQGAGSCCPARRCGAHGRASLVAAEKPGCLQGRTGFLVRFCMFVRVVNDGRAVVWGDGTIIEVVAANRFNGNTVAFPSTTFGRSLLLWFLLVVISNYYETMINQD